MGELDFKHDQRQGTQDSEQQCRHKPRRRRKSAEANCLHRHMCWLGLVDLAAYRELRSVSVPVIRIHCGWLRSDLRRDERRHHAYPQVFRSFRPVSWREDRNRHWHRLPIHRKCRCRRSRGGGRSCRLGPVLLSGRLTMEFVVHVPHSSIDIPEAYREPFLLSEDELQREAAVSADLHTDALAQAAWPEASVVAAPVSRIVCDVERYSDDAEEPMAARGRGMTYTATHDGKALRRQLTFAERVAIQRELYDPHWERLRDTAAGGILVDLHTYPAARWPVETVSSEAMRPEIDLGSDPELTPASWLDALVMHFEELGFETAINTPYSGVIDAGARAAVMIEIRRDVLGDPSDHTRWSRMVRALAELPLPK